jgi:hypothetical protein
MKSRNLWLAIACIALLPACATYRQPLPTVGPAPGATASTTAGKGNLVVYSAWSCFNNYDTIDHSGYMIYSTDGKLVKWVPNFIEGDYTAEPPTRVSLPAGSYQIKAEGGKYGWVMVPVMIKDGQTTSVYLDGERHGGDLAANPDNVVKLPDGEIIGWAANPDVR